MWDCASEQELARDLLEQECFGPGMIVLADRKFLSWQMARDFLATGARILWRASAPSFLGEYADVPGAEPDVVAGCDPLAAEHVVAGHGCGDGGGRPGPVVQEAQPPSVRGRRAGGGYRRRDLSPGRAAHRARPAEDRLGERLARYRPDVG